MHDTPMLSASHKFPWGVGGVFADARQFKEVSMTEITEEFLRAGQSTKGGLTRAQLEILCVAWPPPRGWKKDIIGQRIPKKR